MPKFNSNVDRFVMLCGCVFTKEQLHAKGGKYKCPVHGKGLRHLLRNCRDCGREMTVVPQKGNTRYCPECAHKRKVRSKRASYAKAVSKAPISTKPSSPEQLVSEARWDCIHRSECLTYAILRDNDVLPCFECEDYRPMGSYRPTEAFEELTTAVN
jgi:DNA-directed RNA polymerase subunit RPC12/RpoP